ncbi:hypothetical protein BH11PLA1_BH11PLA1_22270 [soil metagenome]
MNDQCTIDATTPPAGRCCCWFGRRPAFTLIELLVVIAIIAVLVGILVPSLAGVRAYSRNVKCRTNLRSFGQSFQMYLNDNKELMPYVRPFYDPAINTSSDPALLDIFSVYMDAKTPQRENPDDPESKYIPADPFFCPADRKPEDEAGYSLGISYEYWPGMMMVFAEGPMMGDKVKAQKMVSIYWRGGTNIPVMSDAKPWHKNGAGTGQNALFYGDWHVGEVDLAPRDQVTGAVPIVPPPPPPPPGP